MPRLNSGCRRRPPESSPAAPSRRGSPPRHVFPFRRLAALAGRFRRSLLAAVLLALAALVPVLPVSSAVAQEVVEVPRNSPLKPSGLSATQKEFRLLFVTSTARNATSSDIADYNSFVQGSAAAGYSSIRPFASQFRVVGSTNSVDARDNTSTTYTSSNKGVPIYWLRGNRVADEYEDFYDGTWDSRSGKNQSGGGFSASSKIWTGSLDNGRAANQSLGTGSSVKVARLNTASMARWIQAQAKVQQSSIPFSPSLRSSGWSTASRLPASPCSPRPQAATPTRRRRPSPSV